MQRPRVPTNRLGGAALLPLDAQDAYRDRYQAMRPGLAIQRRADLTYLAVNRLMFRASVLSEQMLSRTRGGPPVRRHDVHRGSGTE